MNFEFYFDPEIQSTHIEKHEVTESEIFEFFTEILYLERKRKDNSYIAIGELKSGRYLNIIYRKIKKDLYFIITAFDLMDKELINLIEDYESN